MPPPGQPLTNPLQQQTPLRRGKQPTPVVTKRPKARRKGHRGARGGHRLGGASR